MTCNGKCAANKRVAGLAVVGRLPRICDKPGAVAAGQRRNIDRASAGIPVCEELLRDCIPDTRFHGCMRHPAVARIQMECYSRDCHDGVVRDSDALPTCHTRTVTIPPLAPLGGLIAPLVNC